MVRSVLLVTLAVFGCGKDGNGAVVAKTNPPSGPDCAKAKAHGPLKWFEEDFAAATACAQVMNAPIVLDMWARWCHTCISMQETVFMDPSFLALADKFVFASIDTDKESNATLVAKYSTSAWPTFYVLDPKGQIVARSIGASTLKEFQDFMRLGQKALGGGMAAADARMLGAERALAVRNLDLADQELTAALAAAPLHWPHRAQALGALILTRDKLDDQEGCVEVADKYIDQVGTSPIATHFYWTALNCAAKRSADTPELSKSVRDRVILGFQKMVDGPTASERTDDELSEALGYLRVALNDASRKDEALQVSERLRKIVDSAWAKAPNAKARMAFMWPRAEAYASLDRPLDLVDDFKKLAAELPDEYDPPGRIGWIYMRGGKWAEAAEWTEKSINASYGPRRARMLIQRADIAQGAGDRLLERRYRADAVMQLESLTDGQALPDVLAKARQQLDEADKAARDADPMLHHDGSGAGSASGSGAGSGSGHGLGSGSGSAAKRTDQRKPVGTGGSTK